MACGCQKRRQQLQAAKGAKQKMRVFRSWGTSAIRAVSGTVGTTPGTIVSSGSDGGAKPTNAVDGDADITG